MKEISVEGFPNADAVCKILEACAKNCVASVKMPGFEASFMPHPPFAYATQGAGPTIPPLPAEETIRAQEKAEAASLESQELAAKEDRIAELLLTDPLAAEELLMEGALTPDEDANGGYADGE